MSNFVKEICDYLASSSGGRFSVGTNLNVGELRRGVNGVFAVQSASQEPDRYTPVEYFLVDFWARNVDTETAYIDLQLVYDIFHRNHHYLTNTYVVEYSHAIGAIDDLDRDNENAKLLKVTFEFIVVAALS